MTIEQALAKLRQLPPSTAAAFAVVEISALVMRLQAEARGKSS